QEDGHALGLFGRGGRRLQALSAAHHQGDHPDRREEEDRLTEAPVSSLVLLVAFAAPPEVAPPPRVADSGETLRLRVVEVELIEFASPSVTGSTRSPSMSRR